MAIALVCDLISVGEIIIIHVELAARGDYSLEMLGSRTIVWLRGKKYIYF